MFFFWLFFFRKRRRDSRVLFSGSVTVASDTQVRLAARHVTLTPRNVRRTGCISLKRLGCGRGHASQSGGPEEDPWMPTLGDEEHK